MSTLDPRRSIQAGINRIGVTLFQLECDGDGCTTHVKEESRTLIEEAHERGFATDENIQAYVYGVLRRKAYQVGWSTARGPMAGKDYCPDCLKKGNTRGDMIRKGAGRRKAKR